MSRPIFSDIESPAMKSHEIDNLKTNSKRTGICTAVAFVFGFIGFCMAAAAVAGVRQLMIDSQEKTGAILTVGNASPLKGHSKAHSLYAGSGQWTSKAVLPEPISDYQAVSHKNHVYVIGGQKGCSGSATCAGTVVNTVYQYDTKLDKYDTTKTAMPAVRYRYASAVVGDKIYIIGGLTADDNGMLKTTLIYDITNDSWSTGPNMATGRSDTCAAVVGSKIYVVGGYSKISSPGPITLDSVEVLDTAAASPAWATAPSLPAPRGDITCASSGGKAYAIGGFYDPNASDADGWSTTAFFDTMFEFTPGAAAWVEKAKMPSSRGDKAAVTMSDGSIIVVGGETNTGETHDAAQSQVAAHPVEQYYPAHDTWVAKASIPTARFRFGAAVVDDIVYAMGGHRVCTTTYPAPSFAPVSTCAALTLDSVEALLDVAHPDIWVHV
jgi:N-acetylneuraminic acid mutarotase